ncbi:hypothetical protein VTI74DRAFT_6851 [Chaetomium olivicolor]
MQKAIFPAASVILSSAARVQFLEQDHWPDLLEPAAYPSSSSDGFALANNGRNDAEPISSPLSRLFLVIGQGGRPADISPNHGRRAAEMPAHGRVSVWRRTRVRRRNRLPPRPDAQTTA